MMIPNPLVATACARPDHLAICTADSQLTYSQLSERVAIRAAELQATNIQSGQRVGLCAPSGLDWVINLHAIWWAGAVPIPLDWKLTSYELEQRIEELQPDAVITTRTLSSPRINPMLSTHGTACEAAPWQIEQPCLVLCTSGTTGLPQAIELKARQLVFNLMGSAIRLGHHLDDVWGLCLPLHHVGGLSILIRCAWLGTTVQLLSSFEPDRINQTIDAGDLTLLSLVPTQLKQLVAGRKGQNFPSSLRTILVGGASLSDDLKSRALALGAPLAETWGMTETASQIATSMVNDPQAGLPPLPFATVESKNGRLVLEGPLSTTGMLSTQDRGTIDDNGRVHLSGRLDDQFISGGKNISPQEIERILASHPTIVDVAVVPLPDEHWGMRPVAVLVATEEESRPNDETLKEYCQQGLSRYKIPDQFIWVDALPRNELAKLNRSRLAEILVRSQEAQLRQADPQPLGSQPLLEGSQIDEGMDQPGGGTELPLGSLQSVAKTDGMLPQTIDAEFDDKLVPHHHGALEIGLGVHEGHSPATVLEDGTQAVIGGHQHLFEGDVAVLEDTAEEGYSGPIDLMKTNRDLISKHHDENPAGSWEDT